MYVVKKARGVFLRARKVMSARLETVVLWSVIKRPMRKEGGSVPAETFGEAGQR